MLCVQSYTAGARGHAGDQLLMQLRRECALPRGGGLGAAAGRVDAPERRFGRREGARWNIMVISAVDRPHDAPGFAPLGS